MVSNKTIIILTMLILMIEQKNGFCIIKSFKLSLKFNFFSLVATITTSSSQSKALCLEFFIQRRLREIFRKLSRRNKLRTDHTKSISDLLFPYNKIPLKLPISGKWSKLCNRQFHDSTYQKPILLMMIFSLQLLQEIFPDII